ncbi:MAG: class I SAM-dependent methyltransferase [Candidatus Helarchaeota archaeon]|nr:class I SAM-dependent methyltransferase [Candidatus Helarchaeota archaeon]
MKDRNNSCKKTRYTIDYYNNKWEKYDYEKVKSRVQNFKPLSEKILNLINIQNSMKILDIGTGPGTIPIAIMDKFNKNFNIYGIDPSPISISLAKKIMNKFGLQKGIKLKVGSFENIPFPENSFDLVISNASFNLCTDKIKAIDEISRVVKKPGQIIIADCFKKGENCQIVDDNGKLWAHCISGAITIEWLVDKFKAKNIILKQKINLTKIVKSLILSDKWKWKEFIEYNLDYYSLLFSLE